jgi:hypothetical protein
MMWLLLVVGSRLLHSTCQMCMSSLHCGIKNLLQLAVFLLGRNAHKAFLVGLMEGMVHTAQAHVQCDMGL